MDDIPLRRRIEILEEELLLLQRRVRQLESSESAGEHVMGDLLPPPLPAVMPVVVEEPRLEELVVAISNHEETSHTEEPAAPLTTSAPEPSVPPLPAKAAAPMLPEGTELWIGQVWAVRIGVLLLFTGFVFLANYAWEHYISQLGAMPRLMLLFLLSAAGCAAGEFMRRKPRLETFGEVISAGGLAAIYYCAFASHHISRLRVIESPVIGALLLTCTGLAILGFGAWRRAAVMCSIALLLSFYGTSMQPVPVTAMISGLIVATAGAALCILFRWKSVGLMGLLGAYGSYVLWQGLQFHTEAFSISAWFLCSYWVLFHAMILIKNHPWKENEAVVISILNHGLLATFLPFDWTSNQWDPRCWMVYAVLGVITLGISAWLQKKEGRSRMTEAHLLQGIAFLTLASVTKLSGHQLFFVLGIKAVALLVWDRWSARRSVEWSAYGLLVLSLCLASISLNRHLHTFLWPLYSLLLLSGLCVARPTEKRLMEAAGLRELMRWIMAFATMGIFGTQVLQPLPGAIGALWMIGLSIACSLAERFFAHRFPAKELVPIAITAAVIAGVGLCFSLSVIAPWVMPCALVLAFSHAVTHHQQWDQNAIRPREIQGLFLTLLFWGMTAVYGISKTPMGEMTSFCAIVLMVGVHVLAIKWRWNILAMVTPLFSCAITLLCARLFLDEHPLVWINSILLLVYAAWLQWTKPAHPIRAVPTLLGCGLLCAYLCCFVSHADLYLCSAALAIIITPMRSSQLWRVVAGFWLFVSFLVFCQEPSGQTTTYLFPLMCFGALAYRTRIMQLATNHWTRIIALLITAVMAFKLSEWVGDVGSGYALSILWAILAAFCFGMGFVIREPLMRLAMLLLLLLCMGKILISIWQLGTLMRIASFLVTGMIFLLLGYVYNKHPEWFGKTQGSE